ncbi:cell surface glycoprotein CD200 receptor 1 isoform X2 [Varanus komodoensis]|uniref:cell surface glycoprotein CD200 receptor 1 isoform X2 n=1 Tax=Varanus komodoensis TaxID=61221 RepID=UPI001CF7AE85|nr:cell surface glycoprotein CD200 receptor 1 isoform X2 [Varanus komodoensis]
MEAKSGVNFVMKNWGACSLLTITVAMVTTGSSLSRKAIQNNNAVTPLVGDKATSQLAEDKSHICAVIGTEAVLNCPPESYDLIVWNIELKNGTNCHISYMSKNDTTERNCTENMNWLSRPDQRPDLRIQSPQLFSEGTYKCSVVTINGTFSYETFLSILVPPKVSLTHSINKTAVCKAAASKPAATISWDPPGHSANVEETFLNDMYTVTSRYHYTSTSEDEVSCSIFHPAWNESRVLKISFDNQKPPYLKALKLFQEKSFRRRR